MTLLLSSRNIKESWSRYPGHFFATRMHCEHSGLFLSHYAILSAELFATQGVHLQVASITYSSKGIVTTTIHKGFMYLDSSNTTILAS